MNWTGSMLIRVDRTNPIRYLFLKIHVRVRCIENQSRHLVPLLYSPGLTRDLPLALGDVSCCSMRRCTVWSCFAACAGAGEEIEKPSVSARWRNPGQPSKSRGLAKNKDLLQRLVYWSREQGCLTPPPRHGKGDERIRLWMEKGLRIGMVTF